jgi:hypothetical protein
MADITAAPSNGAQPATPSGAASLHQHAVDAERSLEQLATGLAQAGVDDQVVKTFTQFADVTRKLVSALGAGQEQTADNAPPADEALAPSPPSQPRTIHGAAQAMLGDMAAARQGA